MFSTKNFVILLAICEGVMATNKNGFQDVITMSRMFFGVKYITNIDLLVCWDDYQMYNAAREFSKFGFQTRFLQKLHPKSSASSMGFLLDTKCDFSFNIIQQANEYKLFENSEYWLMLDYDNFDDISSTEIKNVEFSDLGNELLSPAHILPISEVTWVKVIGNLGVLFDVYKIKKDWSLKVTKICEINSDMIIESWKKIFVKRRSTASRRSNLENMYLRSALVISFPNMYRGIDDLNTRHIDPWAKANYPLLKALSEDMNFRFDVLQIDNFGWNKNGTFSGLMGLFQRNEINLGMVGAFIRIDRLSVCDFAAETFPIKAYIIFRQPPLSAVSNIFVQPFNGNVWICCGALCILATFCFSGQIGVKKYINIDLSFLDSGTFILGAVCQQGFHITPKSISGRVVVIFIFVSSLFLFTSYAANIVALLQSPSRSVRSIADLVDSPMAMAVQDTTYNRIYFTESNDTTTQSLYKKKIEPRGKKAFMLPVVGVEAMRKGMFAFQVEANAAYQIISETYTEREKCGLSELEAFRLPICAIPIVKGSPYREIMRQRLRWQREVGIISRTRALWIPQKPVCQAGLGGYVSVGNAECAPAFKVLLYGSCLALAFFCLEILWNKNFRRVIVKND